MSILIKNTFFSALSNVLRFSANAVLLILLARALGAVELGRFLLATSFCAIFAMGIGFGLRWYATKETSQHPSEAQRILSQVINVRIILTCFATVIIALLINVLGYPVKTQLVVGIVWLSVVFASFGFIINSVFRGLNKFEYETVSTFFLNVVQVALVIFFLILKLKTVAIACAYLAARLVYFMICLLLFRRKIGPFQLKINFKTGVALMKQTISYGMYVILVIIFLEITTIFLYQFFGNIGVGFYQAALKVVFTTVMVSDVLVHSFFPVVSARYKDQSAKLEKTANLLVRFLIITGTYLSGFYFLFAPFIIHTLYGQQYQASVPILKILSFVVALRFLAAALSTLLTASDRQRLRTLSVFYALLIIVTLSILFIPAYGVEGAAVSLVVSFVTLAAIELFFVYRHFKRHFFDSNSLYSIILIVTASLISFQLLKASLVLAISFYLLAGFTLYFTALRRRERKEIFSTLRSFGKKGLPREIIPLD